MALFRVDFSGRGELADRQQKLAQMLSRLQKISEGKINLSQIDLHSCAFYDFNVYKFVCYYGFFLSSFAEYNVAVFITNQMTADPGATMS